MSVKLNLTNLLQERGMGLNVLHELTGLEMDKLNILVSDRKIAVRLSTIEKLCKALNITPDELFIVEEE